MRALIGLGLLACLAGGEALAQAGAPPGGRLLASNCFQCHGTDGKAVSGFEKLSGKSPGEIYKDLQEMRGKALPEGIMGVHAKAYTDQQLLAIDRYLTSRVKP